MYNCCLKDGKSLGNVLSTISERLSGCFPPLKGLHSCPCNCDSSRIVILSIVQLSAQMGTQHKENSIMQFQTFRTLYNTKNQMGS